MKRNATQLVQLHRIPVKSISSNERIECGQYLDQLLTRFRASNIGSPAENEHDFAQLLSWWKINNSEFVIDFFLLIEVFIFE